MSKYRITLNGQVYELEIERLDGEKAASPVQAVPAPAPVRQAAPAAPDTAADAAVTRSPMPGTILRVMAAAGDPVRRGQPVLVLEAMKMENEITAPRDGRIVAMHVAQGDTVQGGAPLFETGSREER